MKTAHDFLRDVLAHKPTNFLTYADALKAVQAVIDHYGPLPGKLELLYRVPDSPATAGLVLPARLGACRKCGEQRQQCGNIECPGASPGPRVFAPACPWCAQRRDQCICPPREEPLF